jgi:mRNA deadenylase 3'-5' endonuclease subunit Ccr4
MLKLLRGGSWLSYPRYCRSAYRLRNRPGSANYVVGFRVVCLPQTPLNHSELLDCLNYFVLFLEDRSNAEWNALMVRLTAIYWDYVFDPEKQLRISVFIAAAFADRFYEEFLRQNKSANAFNRQAFVSAAACQITTNAINEFSVSGGRQQ